MQTEQTLIDLGFTRKKEWDFQETGTPSYRLEKEGVIWRSHPITCNGIPYVSLGRVTTPDGKVDRWRDCCSEGSVMRKIKKDESN